MELNALASFFLLFNDWRIVLALILLLSCFMNKKFITATFYLCATSLVLNVALKGAFKIPLSPSNPVPYAFPSGHMQFASAFYLWITLTVPWIMKILISCLLTGIGFSILYFKYHHLADIIAGLMTALLLVIIFYFHYASRLTDIVKASIVLSANTMIMIWNTFLYSTIPSHAWIAYGFMIVLFALSLMGNHLLAKQRGLPPP